MQSLYRDESSHRGLATERVKADEHHGAMRLVVGGHSLLNQNACPLLESAVDS